MRSRRSCMVLVLGAGLLAGGCSIGEPLDGFAPQPYHALRYRGTVRQLLDFSCGGAALATVVTHYWGTKVSEEYILRILRARYVDNKAWEAKAKSGFSMDDLEFVSAALGFNAQGAEVPVDQLQKLNGPVIVHLDKGDFQHFSVLRRIDNDTAYLADPIFGQLGLDMEVFKRQYTGKALAIWAEGKPLPKESILMMVRDGITVRSTVAQVRVPANSRTPGF